MQDDTAVHLQLRLTRTTQTHCTLAATAARAAALSFQVRPQALQSRQHIAVLCQLHLGLGLSRLGSHGEDVQNQTRTVQYLHLQLLLYITYLLGTQLIVEYHHTHGLWHLRIAGIILAVLHRLVVGILAHLDIMTYLLQLAASHVSHAAGAVHLLCEPLHGTSTSRSGQKLQFVQIFISLRLVLLVRNQSHQHGSLGFRLRYHKFLHSVLLSFFGHKSTTFF